MKRIICMLLSYILTFFGIIVPVDDLATIEPREECYTNEELELFEKIYATEMQWLSSLQLENGAIPMTPVTNGEVKMNPYFADFAALALLDDAEKYAGNVKKYMDWHFSHLNTEEDDYNGIDGTIYDYVITVQSGKITEEKIALLNGKKSYDSTDSYAATFLCVLNKYHNMTGDTDYIVEHCEDIIRIVNAMFSTFHKGLTTAKPDWKVKYLMDNCEVYEGALNASELFSDALCENVPRLIDIKNMCDQYAVEIKNTIEEKLWIPLAGHYEVGIRKYIPIVSDVFFWDKYYPCATAQLFPIVHRIISPETIRADKLYNKFCESFSWENFQYPDEFYWGANLQAAVKMNDAERVVTYLRNYEKLIDLHEYPLYNADAARVCLAINELLKEHS